MENNKQVKSHSLNIENRSRAELSGVEKVISSSDTTLNLLTSEGALNIIGKDFKIEKFNIEDGSLALSGIIDTVKYTAAKAPIFKRIFK